MLFDLMNYGLITAWRPSWDKDVGLPLIFNQKSIKEDGSFYPPFGNPSKSSHLLQIKILQKSSRTKI